MLKTQTLNLDLIRTFIVVGQSKDYREASTKLKIDQTNVSRHIKSLEKVMEVKLINRNSNNFIELTEDGKKLFDGWSKGYNLILLTEKNFLQSKTLDTGKLSIGVNRDAEPFLYAKIMEFKKMYPNIVVKLVNSNSKELFEELSKFYLDFVFDERYDALKKCDDIKSISIYVEKYCIAYSSSYYSDLNDIGDLNNIPLILPISKNQDRVKFETFMKENNITKKLSMEVTNYKDAYEYAKMGFGYALLPKRMVENSNDLKCLEIDFEKEISISYANGNVSPSANEFLKLFEK